MLQNDLVTIYTTILMSKSTVPKSVAGALDGFIQDSVTVEDLKSNILPIMEKFSLRSPDVALPGPSPSAMLVTHSDS